MINKENQGAGTSWNKSCVRNETLFSIQPEYIEEKGGTVQAQGDKESKKTTERARLRIYRFSLVTWRGHTEFALLLELYIYAEISK